MTVVGFAGVWESEVPVVWMALMEGPKGVPMVVPRLLWPRALGAAEVSWGMRVVDPLVEVACFQAGTGFPGLDGA